MTGRYNHTPFCWVDCRKHGGRILDLVRSRVAVDVDAGVAV